jgi:hypothetical protein
LEIKSLIFSGISTTSTAEVQKGQTRDASDLPIAFDKLRMTMPQAFNTLLGKNCTFNSDRLAILSNLAQYPYRIKTNQALKESLSFTACIIAIALYNGDLSLLFVHNSIRSELTTGVPLSNLLSWLPYASHSVHSVFEQRNMPIHNLMAAYKPSGDRCLVIDGKALIKGLLWIIEPFHGFDSLKEAFHKLRPADKGEETKRGQLFVRQIINRCLELGRKDILELIITAALPRQLSSPAEIIAFMDNPQEIFTRKRCESPKDIAETEIATALSEPIEVDEILSFKPSTNALLEWIYNAISNGHPLALGKCHIGQGEKEKRETLVSILTLDTTKHRTVFIPLSELDYEYNKLNSFAHLFQKGSFWCITACDETVVADTTMQKAKKRLDCSREEAQVISDQSFKIEPICDDPFYDVVAIWSPRLSRLGMHAPDADRKSWRRIPLGKGMFTRANSFSKLLPLL